MKRAFELGVACLLAVGGARIAAAGEIVVNDSDQTGTYDCAGGGAVVNSGDNVLTFKNCGRVVVNGADNKIDAGAAGAITVMGSGNNVVYTPAPGSRPKIVNLGQGNSVAATAGGGDLEAVVGGDGKAQVSVGADGTVRVEGSKSGAVELSDNGIRAHNAKDILVRENNRTGTLDCAGGNASVDGNSGVLTLRSCRKVTVSGNGNKIEVLGATAISILGNGNEVGWSPGPGGQEARLSDLGKQNVVTRRP